jgi:hypothetical protein
MKDTKSAIALFGGEIVAHRTLVADPYGWTELVRYNVHGSSRWALEEWMTTPSMNGGQPVLLSAVSMSNEEMDALADYLVHLRSL